MGTAEVVWDPHVTSCVVALPIDSSNRAIH